MKQLQKLDSELYGVNKKDEIEDPFTRKKRLEIEAEKEMLKGGVKLKDRVKLWADPTSPSSPRDLGSQSPTVPQTVTPRAANTSVLNKWTPVNGTSASNDTKASDKNCNNSSSQDTNRKISLSTKTDSIDSQGQPRKLTSIISLFNKPKDPNETPLTSGSTTPRSSFSTAPVKKWKTVEPPPPPGFCRNNLKKNKSRKFNNESIKKNKSKGNLNKQPSVESSIITNATAKISAPADVSNKSSTPDDKRNGSAAAVNNRSSFKRQKSRQDSVTSSQSSSSSSPGNKTSATASGANNSSTLTSAPSSKSSTTKVTGGVPPPRPPPPPPKSLFSPEVPKQPSYKSTSTSSAKTASPSSTGDNQSNPTPWRGKKNSREETKAIMNDDDENYNIEPGSTRYRTSFSVSPAREGTKSPVQNNNPVASNKPVAVPPAAPPVPPAAPVATAEKKVFGKGIRPPPMKILGGSISVTSVDKDSNPPPAPKSILKPKQPEPVKEEKREVNNNSKDQKNNYSRLKSVESENGDEDDLDEDEESEEEEEEDEDDEYTQVYDFTNGNAKGNRDSNTSNTRGGQKSGGHPEASAPKGLNRSSTMEILKLIKSKTGSDLTKQQMLDTCDENEEIDALLMGLEDEGIDNVDWDELGIDVEEVKEIVEKHEDDVEDEDEDEDDDEEDVESEEEEEVTMTTVTLKRPSLKI